jgi:hypothetical protein
LRESLSQTHSTPPPPVGTGNSPRGLHIRNVDQDPPDTEALTKLKLTNSIELSITREAASCAATREPPSILWNPKDHYLIHKSPPLVPIPSQTSSVHTTLSHLSEIYHYYPPADVVVFLAGSFPPNNLYAFLLSPIRATCPAHLILLHSPLSLTLFGPNVPVLKQSVLHPKRPRPSFTTIGLYAFKCKRFRNTRHRAAFGIQL